MTRRGGLLPSRLRFLRLLLPVAALALLLVVGLVAGLLAVGQFTGGGGSSATVCDADGSGGTDDTDGTDGGGAPLTAADLDPAQQRAAATVITVGREMAAPPRAWVVALATAMQESRMGLAGMDVAVDHDSLGLFQQRPSQGWGSPEQVRDPAYASRAFLARLLAVPGWDAMPVTRAAQTVQRSAFPGAYARWEPLAESLVSELAGVTGAVEDCSSRVDAGAPAGAVAALPPGVAATVLGAAVAESGKPYRWGAAGPDAFDCSGLVQEAFGAAGVVLPRTSREQFGSGGHVPLAAAQAGDLLFYAYDPEDPDTIHHVALYLGDGRVMEAPQLGAPLGVRAVSFDEAGLVPLATRPGTGVATGAGNNIEASPVGPA